MARGPSPTNHQEPDPVLSSVCRRGAPNRYLQHMAAYSPRTSSPSGNTGLCPNFLPT